MISRNPTLSPSMKHALSFAQMIMDKYYSKTDLSNVYWIVMGMSSDVFMFHLSLLVLHPQMKLEYFKQHK
jgi:hypothetical protein